MADQTNIDRPSHPFIVFMTTGSMSSASGVVHSDGEEANNQLTIPLLKPPGKKKQFSTLDVGKTEGL